MIVHNYSSVNPFNAESSKVILFTNHGFGSVRDLQGNIIRNDLSNFRIVPCADPAWSRTDPNLIYFHICGGNQIKSFNVVTSELKLLATLSNYSNISFGGGEGDISWDGDHLPIMANDKKLGFIYTISTGDVTAAVDLFSYGANPDNTDVTVNNQLLLNHDLPGGTEIFDAAGNKAGSVDYMGHADRGRDINGADLSVATNAADKTPMANCENGIVKKVLPNGAETCAFELDWGLAVHISCNNYSQGWCLVSTYGSKYTPTGDWRNYAHEFLKVNLDGSGVTRLAHHRSSAIAYEAMPRAAVSGDGRYVLFDSDMGGKIDTYILDLGTSAPTPAPAPQTAPATGSGTVDSEEWKFLQIINDYRAQNGLGALQISQALTNSAEWMSGDMAAKNYMSHTDSLGRSALTRMAAFGYGYSTWRGENIVTGNTAQKAFEWWKNACDPNSAGTCTYAHRKNMLNPNYKVIGIGFVSGRWTTDFGGVVDATVPTPVGSPTLVGPHAPGSLVNSGGTIWRITDNGSGRQGIDSLVKFLSHRYSFSNVAVASSADMALPDAGLLSWGHGVLFNHQGTIYQISGSKHGFTSADVFLSLGYDFKNVIAADLTNVPAGALIDNAQSRHLQGTFVLDAPAIGGQAGTVWLMTESGRQGIATPQAFFALGGQFRELVQANAFDLALPVQ